MRVPARVFADGELTPPQAGLALSRRSTLISRRPCPSYPSGARGLASLGPRQVERLADDRTLIVIRAAFLQDRDRLRRTPGVEDTPGFEPTAVLVAVEFIERGPGPP
jgi:hypothetical protein